MTNAASRLKAKNTKNATANAEAKPSSATKVQATKVTAAPARAITSAGSFKPTNTNVNAADSMNAAKASTAKPFALSDVTTWSVQRARQIRKTDHGRFVKFLNCFTAQDAIVTKSIISKSNAKREHVDQWVRSVLNPKTLACIHETQESQQAMLSLISVSAALSKYGEQELVRRNVDNAIVARNGPQSKIEMQHSVGASFVLRLVLGLAPEKRAACQTLREILNLDNAARLVLVPTTKGLKPISSKTNAADWANVNQHKLKYMVKQAQSDKFQDTMQQLGGQHLYDSIRTQLKQVDGVWDASKDRPGLQAKSLRSLLNSTKSSKQQKEAEHRKQQPAKNATKGQIQAVKILEVTKVPPPAPTSLKLTKVTSPVKKAQAKNIGPANNPTQTKNATPIKGVPLLGSWAGPVPASVVLSRPGAIVSSLPTVSARAGNGGRAILSRAI
ncbi:hypothetical protein PR003_g11603 [Phytophthora rubi]|uniref:Uncharacterized protein n=1 Tax=Phytophthora rubi TaxID=129364 RepID=A0A6A4FKV5_9STRA|nr:hypothetical protein PR001_g11121 [Phytophthora rubi]KAE9338233.1 hypothetical protein PR003_g11603 [Phytophthora rubi]